jgi:arylsulfatase A-like enzyme
MFIYVNKRGAHFPYADHYPKDYLPAGSPRAAEYEAAVRYSSRDFIGGMLSGLDLSKTLVIYTSDHGQYFGFDTRRGEGLHCNRDAHWEELSVPLAGATAAPDFASALREAAVRNRNRMQHAQIFPTLLIAMGYDRRRAEDEYGPSLLGPQPPARYYFTAMNPIPLASGAPIAVAFDSFPFRAPEGQRSDRTPPIQSEGNHPPAEPGAFEM